MFGHLLLDPITASNIFGEIARVDAPVSCGAVAFSESRYLFCSLSRQNTTYFSLNLCWSPSMRSTSKQSPRASDTFAAAAAADEMELVADPNILCPWTSPCRFSSSIPSIPTNSMKSPLERPWGSSESPETTAPLASRLTCSTTPWRGCSPLTSETVHEGPKSLKVYP